MFFSSKWAIRREIAFFTWMFWLAILIPLLIWLWNTVTELVR